MNNQFLTPGARRFLWGALIMLIITFVLGVLLAVFNPTPAHIQREARAAREMSERAQRAAAEAQMDELERRDRNAQQRRICRKLREKSISQFTINDLATLDGCETLGF